MSERSTPGPPGAQTVREIGEFGLIAAITARLRSSRAPILGPGDDAALVGVGADGVAVVSTDVLVDGLDFRRDWSGAEDVGHRAAAANLSDIEAMGAKPIALLTALVLPDETEVSWVLGLVDGLVAEATLVDAAVVGGDISGGSEIVVAVTAIGALAGRRAVTRSGARPGDVVAVAGRLGWAAAGLHVLSRGFRSPRDLVEAHRRPRPPYGLGAAAAAAGATAMIDVSDGLLADLAHVSRASGVRIELSSEALPVDDCLRSAAAAFNLDPVGWALTGGDDHPLAATFPPNAGIPQGFVVVGHVTAPDESGGRVAVDGRIRDESGGYSHFG